MKKVLIISLIAFTAYSQPQLVWEKFFGPTGGMPVSLVVTPANNYVAIHHNSWGPAEAISFSQDSVLQWKLNLADSGQVSISNNCATRSPQGHVFAKGDSLLVYNEDGIVIKSGKVPGNLPSPYLGIYYSQGTGHYYAVEQSTSVTADDKAVITILDSNFNVIRTWLVMAGVRELIFKDGFTYANHDVYGGGNEYNRSSWLIKYDSLGNVIWTRFYPDHTLTSIAISGNHIYYSGVRLSAALPHQQWAVERITEAGDSLWRREWGGDIAPTMPLGLWTADIVSLPNGGCIIAGSATVKGQSNPNVVEPTMIAFSPEGEYLWKFRNHTGAIGHFQFIKWDSSGYLIALARRNSKASIDKYRIDGVTSVIEESGSGDSPEDYKLGQNYPNPFNPSTKINFSVPERGFVTLTVYDLLGREVEKLVEKEFDAGSYSVDFSGEGLASGIYIYRLETGGNFTASKKMMLVK